MTGQPDDYALAIAVRGLPTDRQQRLWDHLQQSSRLAPEGGRVAPAVARCAAVLLAVDVGQRLSAPTAVAQAEALAAIPQVGEALVRVFEGAAVLSRAGGLGCLGPGSVHRCGVARALRFLAAELERVAVQMEAG